MQLKKLFLKGGFNYKWLSEKNVPVREMYLTWPLNTGDCLLEVTAKTILTVFAKEVLLSHVHYFVILTRKNCHQGFYWSILEWTQCQLLTEKLSICNLKIIGKKCFPLQIQGRSLLWTGWTLRIMMMLTLSLLLWVVSVTLPQARICKM